MSDELLRHISDNPSLLVRRRVFDPETNKTENIWTGQSARLLLKMLSHANKERVVFVGRTELMEKCDLNGQSIDTFKRRFSLDGILTHVGKRSYQGSAPVDCYLIDLPELPPLEDVMSEEEIKQRARKARNLKKAPKVVLTPASDNVLEDALVPALDHDLPVRHKQEQEQEQELQLQLQLKQVFDRYTEVMLKKQTSGIKNKTAWRKAVIANASREIAPQGDTYLERAKHLLAQGYMTSDIGDYLSDGCINGRNITFWDKRPGFIDKSDVSDDTSDNDKPKEDDADFPF